MAKKNNDYFKMIEEQTSYCLKAANLLESILENFDVANVAQYRSELHEIEHAADDIHHDIMNKLSTEFITPIDQEDILQLAQIIDTITDALDEVMLEFYMFHLDHVPAKALELCRVVKLCVTALHEAAGELKNFKKPAALRSFVIKVNDIESQADTIYATAIHDLFASDAEIRVLLGSKEIYESLESCCDMCEDVTDVIEQVIIKNT